MAAQYTLHAAKEGGAPTKPAFGVARMINGPLDLDWEAHMKREFRDKGTKQYTGPDAIVTHIVGDVSWLKAALFEDGENTYVPSLIEAVSEIVPTVSNGVKEITDEMIAEVKQAITASAGVEDESIYEQGDPESLLIWLDQYKGWQCWSVSW